MEATKVQKDDI